MTADLRVGVTFGRYQLSLYANNAFDEYAYQTASTELRERQCNDPEAAHDRRSVQRRLLTI